MHVIGEGTMVAWISDNTTPISENAGNNEMHGRSPLRFTTDDRHWGDPRDFYRYPTETPLGKSPLHCSESKHAVPNKQKLLDLKSTARMHLDTWEGRYVDIVGPSTPESPALKPVYGRTMDVLWNFVEAQADFFLTGKLDKDVISRFHKVAELCSEYLTGEWREQAIKDDRECLDWMEQVRFGLLSALLSNDSASLTLISQYALSEPDFETGAFDRTKQDASAYRVGCRSILDTTNNDPGKFSATRAKNFAFAVLAADSNDARKSQKHFASHLKRYIEREHDDRGNIQFAIDSSILALIIQRKDIVLDLEKWRDYLIV